MKRWQSLTVVLSLALLATSATYCLTGCSSGGVKEHYVSPEITGESQKINLEEVQKAFFETKGDKDFNSKMASFEKRVNEIYDGEGVVALDATHENDRLSVVGYIDKDKKSGFQSGDEKLFAIEQTGPVVNNELPYRVAGYDGRPYYEGHRSILDNPFVQMMVMSHMINMWGGRYSTPYSRYGGLMGHQSTWRQTPQYSAQKSANQGFFSRFKTRPDGGLTSKSGFGNGSFSSSGTTARRSWGGIGTSSSTPSASSSWGGRRSSGFSMRRSGGWGGRRR
jgi:hypothetical protein